MGYYCPRAVTDPTTLKTNTPTKLEEPTEPEVPEGVALADGASCPELDTTGKRTACDEDLCCGLSWTTSKPTAAALKAEDVSHCKAKTNNDSTYTGADGVSYKFECYLGAEKLVVGLAAAIGLASMI